MHWEYTLLDSLPALYLGQSLEVYPFRLPLSFVRSCILRLCMRRFPCGALGLAVGILALVCHWMHSSAFGRLCYGRNLP